MTTERRVPILYNCRSPNNNESIEDNNDIFDENELERNTCCEEDITDSCLCDPEIIETTLCCHLIRKRKNP